MIWQQMPRKSASNITKWLINTELENRKIFKNITKGKENKERKETNNKERSGIPDLKRKEDNLRSLIRQRQNSYRDRTQTTAHLDKVGDEKVVILTEN